MTPMTLAEPTDPRTAKTSGLTPAATPDTEADPGPSPAQEMTDAGRASRSHPRFPLRLPTQSPADWMLADGSPMPLPAWTDIRMPGLWPDPKTPSGAETRA